MAAFEEQLEQLVAQLRSLKEKIEESPVYNNLKDRYQNLTPVQQKSSLIGAVVLGVLILMSAPLSFYFSSAENVSSFEKRRNLIRDLFKSTKEATEVPDIPPPPPMEAAKAQIEGALKMLRLLPEQILSIEVSQETTSLIPAEMTKGGLRVQLGQLNLRQVVEIGNRLQAIKTSLKLKDLILTPSVKNPKYFDVVFKLLALNVPEAPPIEAAPPEPPANSQKPKKTNKDEEF